MSNPHNEQSVQAWPGMGFQRQTWLPGSLLTASAGASLPSAAAYGDGDLTGVGPRRCGRGGASPLASGTALATSPSGHS